MIEYRSFSLSIQEVSDVLSCGITIKYEAMMSVVTSENVNTTMGIEDATRATFKRSLMPLLEIYSSLSDPGYFLELIEYFAHEITPLGRSGASWSPSCHHQTA